MLAGELVMVKQGDGRIGIASQMVCGMMLVSAAVADDAAALTNNVNAALASGK
jgi:hypothetical protein